MATTAQGTSKIEDKLSAEIGSTQAQPMAPLLTAPQVATLLGLHTNTVYLLANKGELPCVRVGNKSVRFTEADVEQFVETHRA